MKEEKAVSTGFLPPTQMTTQPLDLEAEAAASAEKQPLKAATLTFPRGSTCFACPSWARGSHSTESRVTNLCFIEKYSQQY